MWPRNNKNPSFSRCQLPFLKHLVDNFIIFLQLLKFPKIRDRHLQTPLVSALVLVYYCYTFLLLLYCIANYERLREGSWLPVVVPPAGLRRNRIHIRPVTAIRRRVSSIQLTAFNQPSAITVIASVGHAPVTSEPMMVIQGLSRSCSFRGDCGIPTLWYATARASGMCRPKRYSL